MTDPRYIPVIVATGEMIDRENTQEPRTLLLESVRAAAQQAPGILERVDSIDVVSIVSWRYADIGHVLARDLGITPTRAVESSAGGEKPVRLLGEAAERIAAGVSQAAILCGAEATRTRARAAQSGQALAWEPRDPDAKPITALDFVTPHAARYGLIQPPQVYPLYENATRHAWQQTFQESELESATLWSRYSQAAATNPYAWLPRVHSAEQIAADSPDNRMIAFPYRKLMVANPSVNQGAAILITNLAAAREAGISAERIVYVWGGARANEPADFLARAGYDRSPAQDAVLNTTLELNGITTREIDLFEFYSCFPTVPKMARRTLGLGPDVQPSVTGGLTFFGGPANNFMTHAIAAAVRAIQSKVGRSALLYGQGEFVTKHAAMVIGVAAPTKQPEMRNVQSLAESMSEGAPKLLEDYEGEAIIETFTIVYDREGAPVHAPIVARTSAGERVVARVPGENRDVIELLSDRTNDPIGTRGRIVRTADGLLHFSL